MKTGAFGSCHPAVNFVYFAFVLACTMIILHPVCLGISLLCAAAYAVLLRGKGAVRRSMKYLLPAMLIAALFNPLFNHRGVTTLGYLPGGNPLTLEAVLYGVAASVMLAAALCWFSCCSAVMTSDKLICLFGRAAPGLSLLLSMVLRFVPQFTARLKAISDAQRCMGHDATHGTMLQRAQNGVRMLSILVTWSLEHAVETADSMKSRGYGLPGRTAFSIYRFDRRDGKVLCLILCAGGVILAGAAAGGLAWSYFPSVRFRETDLFSAGILAAYLVLCALPLMLQALEDISWNISH